MQATIITNYTSTSPSPTPNLTALHQLTQTEGTYEGELKENSKHGLGIFIWQNGDAYFGQWSDNKMQGKGIFCYNTGHYFEGNFKSNLVNGAACLTYPDGSFIKGVFTNGELCGRVIFYQAEKNAWFLQTYEAGKLTEVHYEGSGKPMTYDFCVNIYEEDLQGFSAKSVDSNYRIKSSQKDSAAIESLGCFEIDSETRHFGVIKNNRITGLGLRIHGKAIEAGKYRDGQLEGFGRRLEFGKLLYEGEFIQGKPYGQGAFYQWKIQTLTVGIFTADMLMQKLDERSFSLQDLDNFSSSQAHSGTSEVVKFSVRTYEDSFARNYADFQHQKYELNPMTTTIKEIEYAKVIARETIIEQTAEGYGPRRHRLQEDLQNHADYIKQRLQEDPQFFRHHKRSHSSESNLETPFSPLFRIDVDDKQPNSSNNRSKSKDSGHFGRNQQRFEIQTSGDLRFNLFNTFSHKTTQARNIDVGSPGAIPTFGKSEEAHYPSVSDLSPQLLNSLGSIRGLSQGSPMTNPFTIQNYSNFLLSSPPSTVDKTHSRSNSNIGLVSPPSSMAKSAAEKLVHAANNQYQAKKLNKDRNASKSSVGLMQSQLSNGNLLSSQQSPVYHIDGNSTSRGKATTPSTGFGHKHTLSNIQFPGDSQNRGWETMRSPSSLGLSSNTPTKKRKAGESPNNTSSRGVNPMIQALMKKGSGSTSTSSTGFAKKTIMGKDKGLCSPDGQLVYVGSTSYAKKPAGSISSKNENLRSKGKDSSPLGRTQGRKDNMNLKNNHKEQEPIMTKSPKISKLLQVQSPTYASDLSLQSYSISEKMRNEKKDGGKQGVHKTNNTADRSPLSARNAVLSANVSPRIAPFVSESSVSSIKQAGQKTARENYPNYDEKLSSRSKSPLVTNVNLDLSMFRAKTPGAISDFDCQKTSAGQQLLTGRDQSPFSSYRRSESPFADSENLTKGLETQTAARFSFIPESESPYSSITQRETMRSTFKVDDTIQGIVAYKEVPKEGKEIKEKKDGKRTPTLSLDLSVKTNNVEKQSEGDSSQAPKEKSFHRRAGSQVMLSDLEREKHINVIKTPKFSFANSKLLSGESRKSCETPKSSMRYNASSPVDLSPIDNALPIPNNNRVSSSPDRLRSGSPYKIDVQQERLNSRSKSPQKDKDSSNHTRTSPCRHSHTSLDSPIGGYPVKKTCDPKLDPCYYEMRQSGQKASSQRGSPLRNSRGITNSPDKQETPSQVKMIMSGNSDQKPPRSARKFEYTPDKESGEARISITDIFRKSLNLVQSRAENTGDEANFDLKALPTVYSRYENCADSRTFQGFPTKSSNKITEGSSPDRQSLNRNRAMLTSYSNKQGQTMSPSKEKEVIEPKMHSSPEKEEEIDLTDRLRECLAKTKANIQMIEKMDRERESVCRVEQEPYREQQEFITGIKRSKPTSGNTVNSSVGSSSSGVKKTVNEMKQTFGVETNQRLRTSSSKGMLSSRSSVTGPWTLVRESQNLVIGEEGNRMVFTFREQKDEGLKSFVAEEGHKAGKDYKRSSSLSKRQSKMGVKSIALYKDEMSEISDGNTSLTNDVKRRK